MKYLLLLTGIACLLFSCKKSSSDCTPEEFRYTYSISSSFDSAWLATAIPFDPSSEKNIILFTYQHTGQYCKNQSDPSDIEYLGFAIPVTQTSFSYKDSELKKMNCYYNRMTWWSSFVNTVPVTQGTVTGNKLSPASWLIQVAVTVNWGSAPQTIEFTQVYKPE